MDSVELVEFEEYKNETENTVIVAGQGQGEERQIVKVSTDDL